VLFADTLADFPGACVAIAHRQELVSQISLTLARYGVRHRIIGPQSVVRFIVALHMEVLGRSFYDPNALCAVAGVDTLIRRADSLKRWLPQVGMWVMDECHHVLKDNKWGKAVAMFPNAKGLGVTANTVRADGKGLGRHADGVADALIVGPSMRELINAGYLTDYRIFAPPSDLDVSEVAVSRVTGDYNPNQLKVQVKKSHIIGDVVTHYKRLAMGKLGITFATDVEIATDIAAQYNAAGVPAAVVSAKTPDRERMEIQRRFQRRELLQMVNVDLFGEGYDVPSLEVVSMARPTESFNLFCQQFGRALRIMDGKTEAIIIDHVGNTLRHGLPDAPITWTLDRRERRARASNPDLIPTRVCTECMSLYERVYIKCPWCGHIPVPAVRSGPEFVDGDLLELDAATLAAMRDEVASVDRPDREIRDGLERAGSPAIVAMGAAKQHRLRQDAQTELRNAIALWGGKQRAEGRPDSESYRRFYFRYKIDVLGAQALGRPDAEALTKRIRGDM
jgi:superfamily II DNA or RNA helicase